MFSKAQTFLGFPDGSGRDMNISVCFSETKDRFLTLLQRDVVTTLVTNCHDLKFSG